MLVWEKGENPSYGEMEHTERRSELERDCSTQDSPKDPSEM